MKRSLKLRIVIIAVIVLLIAALGALWFNSYSIVLWRNGFHNASVSIIDAGLDANGDEYRVVQGNDIDLNVRLAYMTKGIMGTWKVWYVEDTPSAETGMVRISWTMPAGFQRFRVGDDTTFEYESHLVYCGDNANKKIEIPAELLPPNVTVSIQQGGTSYTLHFITFGDEGFNDLDVYDLLKKSGCITD